MKSKCCHDEVVTKHGCDQDLGHGGKKCDCEKKGWTITFWNECSKCNKPCDIYQERELRDMVFDIIHPISNTTETNDVVDAVTYFVKTTINQENIKILDQIKKFIQSENQANKNGLYNGFSIGYNKALYDVFRFINDLKSELNS